jgi:hypothetical protein
MSAHWPRRVQRLCKVHLALCIMISPCNALRRRHSDGTAMETLRTSVSSAVTFLRDIKTDASD